MIGPRGGPAAAITGWRIDREGYAVVQCYRTFIDQYKRKYAAIRDSGERVIIDGVCNSSCTLVLGIVPLNRICATPRVLLSLTHADLKDG